MGNLLSSTPEAGTERGQRLRDEADALYKSARESSQKSQDAYKSGRHADARLYSEQAASLRAQAQCKAKEAADAVFQEKNAGRPIGEIDLHGLFVEEALERLKERIQTCKRQGVEELVVITGIGRNSVDNVPKIKERVKQLVQEENIEAEVGVPNEGCVTLHLKREFIPCTIL
ncbi:hypothetical protein HDU96_007018 [Phlyctochytrium bullatum]|nr:hypothetical protein HDU96_007018 [Phlyctochytrium bullatum]